MQQLVGRSFPFRFASGPETHFAQHRELEEARCALVQEQEKTKEAQAEADELMGQVIRAQVGP